ncbi:hypothetical protein GCM10022284_44480 [Streptomyces hundungensis]
MILPGVTSYHQCSARQFSSQVARLPDAGRVTATALSGCCHPPYLPGSVFALKTSGVAMELRRHTTEQGGPIMFFSFFGLIWD